ncbi:MAG: GrpB family protein [Steroidobacteraceae bacterium]
MYRCAHIRDLLISDPRLAAEYETVKRMAARKYPTGVRSQYTEEKAGYNESLLA